MKQINIVEKIFVILFFIIIFIFMILTLTNDKKISLVERRELKTFPDFTVKNIFSKTYYDDLTNAFNDQLSFRNYLVKGYFLMQFQRYYGNVVKGSNNEIYTASETREGPSYYKSLKEVTEKINEESKKIDAKFIFLSIPRKDAYMTKELPKSYNSSIDIYKKQTKIVSENLDDDIIFIDALDVFKKGNIYKCYYSNDHHITPRCAYLLYKEINKYTKVNSYELEDEFEVKQTLVNGSYNRQLGQTAKKKLEDLYLIPKNKLTYVRYENDKKSAKKVFGKGNTYTNAYMGGDMAYTKIVTNKNGKNIMFVGSSFTNILEAMSVPSYKTVTSIDYRHNKTGHSINYYVKKNNIDYVVFVPSQSNNAFSIKYLKLHLGI